MKGLLLLLSILATSPITRDANVAVLICDVATKDTIVAYRPNCVIPPASTMKLLTTATALDMWEKDYRFQTPITHSGTIRDGVLNGNLYIEGKGDPTLASRYVGRRGLLYIWARQIKQAGIKKITGKVIGDASFFDGNALNPAWIWEDAGNYYAPGIFALSYMDNTVNIVLQSGPIGSIATVLNTTPVVPGLEFENHIRCTDRNDDGAFVHGVPYSNKRYLIGSVPSNRQTFGVMGDMPNPPLMLAMDLTKVLRETGIEVMEEAGYISEEIWPKEYREQLFIHESEPLSEIIRHTNHKSDNLYAEMIFRTFGKAYSTPCTIHNSSDFVRSYWRNRGIFLTTTSILDGCGLAPQDAVSPSHYVQLLRYMYNSRNKDAWIASLPRSGESGTLSGFLRGTELQGRVVAKSGTITGTKNYAGYIFLPDGRVWVFAIMVNSAQGKSKDIMRVIEQYLLNVYRANK